MDRRRRERITARIPFDVYCQTRRLGRFWTRNISQEGLFLNSGSLECLSDAILDLCFQTKGMEYRFRGVVVHQLPGDGVGIELAHWRTGDRLAHSAYRQFTMVNYLSCAA